MDLGNFKTDQNLENEGVIVPTGKCALCQGKGCENCDQGKSWVKLARIGSTRYKEVMQRRLKPYAHLIRANALPEKEAEHVLVESLVEAVLLDWKGFSEDGKPLPFNKDNARRALQESPDFRQLIQTMAEDAAIFRQQGAREDVKNS